MNEWVNGEGLWSSLVVRVVPAPHSIPSSLPSTRLRSTNTNPETWPGWSRCSPRRRSVNVKPGLRFRSAIWFRSDILIPNSNPIPNPFRSEPNNFPSIRCLVSGRQIWTYNYPNVKVNVKDIIDVASSIARVILSWVELTAILLSPRDRLALH